MPEEPNKGEKYRDHVSLLISDKKFQEEIKRVRIKLNIPPQGFIDETDIGTWHEQDNQETDKIFDSKEFQESLIKINKDLEGKKITYRESKNLKYKAHLVIPTNYIAHAVKEVIKNFNLPENYDFMLRTYLVNNSVSFLSNNFSISYSKEGKSISVNIYTRLTDEDLGEIKEFVNTVYKDRLPHIQRLNDLDIKLAIEKLAEEGCEIDAITGEEYKLSDEEIAEKILKDGSKAGYVYEAKRNLERLRDARFRPSENS